MNAVVWPGKRVRINSLPPIHLVFFSPGLISRGLSTATDCVCLHYYSNESAVENLKKKEIPVTTARNRKRENPVSYPAAGA